MFNSKDQLKYLANPKYSSKYQAKSISPKTLKDLYYEMLKIRKVELKIADLVHRKKVNTPVHLSVGQEAIPAGISKNLNSNDQIFGNHRSHGHIISRNTNLKKFFAECFGKKTGLSKGFGGSMHLIDKSIGFQGSVPIVAATIPIACGYGLALKIQKKRGVIISYFGDGACEEGVFHETLNFASVYKIPIIFVVENNLFSSHLDINLRQTSNKISRFAVSNNIDHITIDGNNVIEVFKKSKNIIKKVRKKKIPYLIEAVTYRHLGHVGPNKDIDVGVKRNKKELLSWINNRDPIKNLEKFLILEKIVNIKFIENSNAKIDKEINKAVSFALNSNFPNQSLMSKLVYNG